jgi:triosephosphate isomerase
MKIIVNAKTYPKKLDSLVKACDIKGVGLAVQAFDLREAKRLAKKSTIYAQHLDAGVPGRNTGFVLAENVRKLGIKHTLLNHSEHKIPFAQLKETIKECKKLDIEVVACADTPAEAKKIAALKPNYIAVEPPSLIGGDVSVTTKPQIITKALKALGKIPLLVGAGVKTVEDVHTAKELGAAGILVASGIVKAKNPRKVLTSFIEH